MLYTFDRYSLLLALLATTCTMVCDASQLPAAVKKVLDSHAKQLQVILRTAHDQPHLRMGAHVHEVPWLPGYLIKYGTERFYNAQKIESLIRKHNLHLLGVANKYLYHVPGRPEKIADKNYLVIVKKILPEADAPMLNLEQVKQLCEIALLAHHYDLHTANYIISGGKIVIIDTDKGAMPPEKTVKKFEKDRLTRGVRVLSVGGMNIFNDPLAKIAQGVCPLHNHYDDAAKAYVLALVAQRNAFYLTHNAQRSALLKFLRLA